MAPADTASRSRRVSRQPQLRHPLLAGAEVMRQLVTHDERDHPPQGLRITAEVALQRVAEDQDPMVVTLVGDRPPVVQAVVAVPPVAASVVGDDDGDVVLEHRPQMRGKLVERCGDETLDTVVMLGGVPVRRDAALKRGCFALHELDELDELLELLVGHLGDLAVRAAIGLRLHVRVHDHHRRQAERAPDQRQAQIAGAHREPRQLLGGRHRHEASDPPVLRQRRANRALGTPAVAVVAGLG